MYRVYNCTSVKISPKRTLYIKRELWVCFEKTVSELTVLICGHCYSCEWLGRKTQLRNSIHGFYFKGVIHMRHKVKNYHGTVDQASVSWDEAESSTTVLALAGVWATLLTDYTVCEVFPPSCVTWWAPFQNKGRFIDVKNHIPRSWWRP